MSRKYALVVAAVLGALLAPQLVQARGAYVLESQYSFPNPENVQIIGPFIDGDGIPWVLGNHVENGTCLLIGPFTQDDPEAIVWALPEQDGDVPVTQCLSVEPGPEQGFLIRGYIPGDFFAGEPDLGFIVSLDDAFETLWGPTFDETHVDVGHYGIPSSQMAWSERRGRVLTFFFGIIDIGPDTANHLHGMSIADGTGIVRRVIRDWGGIATGTLNELVVVPDDGKFLVVGHDNGTEFLIYDGLESISSIDPGEVDWSDRNVAYVQYGADDSLYIVHFPRLDMGGIVTYLSRFSSDGEIEYYTRDLVRVIEVIDPVTELTVAQELPRPVLSYATTSTMTLVRIAGGLVILQVLDNFNGREMAIQPLSTIDPNVPTHLIDARSPDRLVLMSGIQNPDGSIVRYVDIIAWDPDAETPGGIPSAVVDPDELDGGGLADGSTLEYDRSDVTGIAGCCRTVASRPEPSIPLLGVLLVGAVLLLKVRRREE